jgi:hypothetical protein
MRKSLFWRIHRFMELRGLDRLRAEFHTIPGRLSSALMADHEEMRRRHP